MKNETANIEDAVKSRNHGQFLWSFFNLQKKENTHSFYIQEPLPEILRKISGKFISFVTYRSKKC
jgi:hypothetical protein